MKSVRIGQGFDVHAFGGSRPLVVCGVTIESEEGLQGHSDADVGLHAVADAIFGAVAAGDLGEHFPSNEPEWHDMESRVFVERALDIASGRGFSVVNCDLTVIGERPPIAPHRNSMRLRVARLLGVSENRVSVKATTSDGLGFCGRGEGLAALAVILLEEAEDDD